MDLFSRAERLKVMISFFKSSEREKDTSLSSLSRLNKQISLTAGIYKPFLMSSSTNSAKDLKKKRVNHTSLL